MLQALILFKDLYPGYRTEEIEALVRSAATFIETKQQEDGSWFVLMHHLPKEFLRQQLLTQMK